MHENLLKAVTNLGSPKVLLVGDFMLDVYIYGDALRISPEAPVPVLRVTETEYRCGGAASVAADLAALGAKPICLGIIGCDENSKILTDKLTQIGADIGGLVKTPDRPTVSKQRLIGLAQHRHRQVLMRIDRESTDPPPDKLCREILDAYRHRLADAEVVCLQDYGKGLLNAALCKEMIELAAKADKKILVDPAPAGDYSKYAGATVITPNRKETSATVGFEIEDVESAAKAAEIIRDTLNMEAVVLTLDKEGAYLKTNDASQIVPTRPRSVYDVTGAGDMVLATLAVALAADFDYSTAVRLSNITGGIEVEKFGTATVTIQEIIDEIMTEKRGKAGKLRSLDELLDELDWHRRQKQTIVFTNGCFDVIHRGHVEYLKFTKQQGDIVVLAMNSDNSVRNIKGPDRPINNQNDRAEVMAALESIDYITIFDDPTPIGLIEKIRPDVLVKGEDWADKGVVGREFVESHGGKVVLAPLVKGRSSTATIEKIKSLQAESG